jgi:transposase
MKRFIEGRDRSQVTLLPECLDDYIGEDNPVRVVDAFVDELDLEALGFEGSGTTTELASATCAAASSSCAGSSSCSPRR